jgi:hypothetical protein
MVPQQGLQFPGTTLQLGSPLTESVRLVQSRMNALGLGPLEENGMFDKATVLAVKTFQMRSVDPHGVPLNVDGKVGPLTWATMFGSASLPAPTVAPGSLTARVLEVASAEVGVQEEPPGSNRGKRVDQYIRRVGLDPAGNFAWCAAFVYFCFDEACTSLGRSNPVVKVAGVREHWRRARAQGVVTVEAKQAQENTSLVKPGLILMMGFPGGLGHTGLVESLRDGRLVTIEGNTNEGGSRNGVGVFRREMRKIADANLGFIDYLG